MALVSARESVEDAALFLVFVDALPLEERRVLLCAMETKRRSAEAIAARTGMRRRDAQRALKHLRCICAEWA